VHGKKIQLPEGKDYAHGSTGSRLLAGHSKLAEEVEEEIADGKNRSEVSNCSRWL
jgi:7-keto-8-aminopelargonate synthetase-like enzyme